MTDLDDIIDSLTDYPAPYLFVGSGFSRRYADAPDWETLLRTISDKFNINLGSIMRKCRYGNNLDDINFPLVGEILQDKLEEIKTENDTNYDFRNITAIKEECLEIFLNMHKTLNYSQDELVAFKKLLNNISGIVTTNYDQILEELSTDLEFESYIGQSSLVTKNLVFSDEIFKIHGCVSDRESIVITEKDYKKFENRQKYILGKLTVLFVEFPIIFIGYSMNDKNIKKILDDLILSLTYEELKIVSKKWIFIEYKKGEQDFIITERRIRLDNDQHLIFQCIEIDNYKGIYEAFSKIQHRVIADKKNIKYIKKMIADYEFRADSKILGINFDNVKDTIDSFKDKNAPPVAFSFGTVIQQDILNVNIFEVMKDLLFDTNECFKSSNIKFVEQYKLVMRGTYYPRYKYFSSDEIKKYGIPTLNYKDINWPSFRNISKQYNEIKDISDKILYWKNKIWKEGKIKIELYESFLKEIFEGKNSLKEIAVYCDVDVTTIKKLFVAYDIIKYKGKKN